MNKPLQESAIQSETVLKNAQIILKDSIVLGSVQSKNGVVTDIAEGASRSGFDLQGGFLFPGFVELHTDHLEFHHAPRPGVRWDPTYSAIAHDAQMAASGITTVFDALCVGFDSERMDKTQLRAMLDAIAEAGSAGYLRAEHFVHLRCEVPVAHCVEDFMNFTSDEAVKLVSLMDHTPGQRQFTSIDAHKRYYQGKVGMDSASYDAMVLERKRLADTYADKNRIAISKLCEANGLIKASHDDATASHVAEAVRDNVKIAEFPTTVDAARASQAAGMKVLMGAPNVVRGGSHSGNVSALDLAERDLLHILSSDYVPLSLLQGVFKIADALESWDLPRAARLVTSTPAEAVGLNDRGTIAVGKRADFVHVSNEQNGDHSRPIIRSVWRQGERVC